MWSCLQQISITFEVCALTLVSFAAVFGMSRNAKKTAAKESTLTLTIEDLAFNAVFTPENIC